MSIIKKYQAALRHRTNPRYMTKDFIVPLYTGTEPDILDDSNTQRESSVYKEFPNDMPIISPKRIQNQPYEQLELADGGSVERQGFSGGTDFKEWLLNEYKNKNKINKTLQELIKDSNIDVKYATAHFQIANNKTLRKKFNVGEWKVKPLPEEMKNIFKLTYPNKKWEELSYNQRGNFINDFSRKQKILESIPKNYITIDELVEKINVPKETLYETRTNLGKFINEKLKPMTFGSIKGGFNESGTKVGGTVKYFKDPGQRLLNKILEMKETDFQVDTLNNKTIKNINNLYDNYLDSYKQSKLPNFEDIKNMTPGEVGTATTRLAQILDGKKFRNEGLENIRVNKNIASKMFEQLNKHPWGDPYRSHLYKISLDTIDQKLGNKKGTFNSLKKEAVKILKENNIPIYNLKDKNPKGFNINEIAGTTGSSRSEAAEFSQFIDIMDGNLNQKKLASFQSVLSRARSNIETNPDVFNKEAKKLNTLASSLEEEYGVKLPRIRPATEVGKYYTQERLTELNKLGLDIEAASKRAGYTIQMPKGASTIQEFINDPEIRTQMIANIGCPTIGKSLGGRVNFSEGSNCYAKGLEKIQSGELNTAERKIAVNFLKNAGAEGQVLKGILAGTTGSLKILQELTLGSGVVGGLTGAALTIPFAGAKSARGAPGGFGRELIASAVENLNIIPGIDIDASKFAGTQVTQALERSERLGSQKIAKYSFPIQETSKEIDKLINKKDSLIDLQNNPSIETPYVSSEMIKDIEKQINDKKLILQEQTINFNKNVTQKDLNDANEDIKGLMSQAFSKGKKISDLLISNTANPEVKKYVQENPNRIILNAQNIPTFINDIKNEFGETASPFVDQITKKFQDLKVLGEQGESETGIITPSGYIDVTDLYNQYLPSTYKESSSNFNYEEATNIENMGREGAADGGRIELGDGSGPKIGRRGFLGLLTGAAAAPELIKAIKGEKKAIQAVKAVSKLKFEKAQGMYPWFPDLVEKIKVQGKPFEEKEIIMEASYKHQAKGYGGLPKGVEKVTKHVDGDTEFLLREYPDGRIAVDIHSPRNQEGSSTPVTLYYRPTMELKYYNGVKVEPAEFKVLEKQPRYFANGPDDVDIEMSEIPKTPGRQTIYGDVEAAERFATGDIKNRKIIPAKQARREQMEDAPTDFIEETSPHGY